MLFLFNKLCGAFWNKHLPADSPKNPYGRSICPKDFVANSNKGVSGARKIEVLKKIFVSDFI